MYEQVKRAVDEINKEYVKSFTITEKSRTADIKEITDFLGKQTQEQKIERVYGRGKRKNAIQRYLEMAFRLRLVHRAYCTYWLRCGCCFPAYKQ